jgi:hypothetical protein
MGGNENGEPPQPAAREACCHGQQSRTLRQAYVLACYYAVYCLVQW